MTSRIQQLLDNASAQSPERDMSSGGTIDLGTLSREERQRLAEAVGVRLYKEMEDWKGRILISGDELTLTNKAHFTFDELEDILAGKVSE